MCWLRRPSTWWSRHGPIWTIRSRYPEPTIRCEADTRALIAEAWQRRGGDAAWTAYTAPEIAEQVRDERRMTAVRRLMASEDADTEADAAYETALRQRPRDLRAAEAAADGARRRTANYLLRTRLGQLLPGGEADGRRLAVWLAGVHDVGKATPAVACQVEQLADAMREQGLEMRSGQAMGLDRRLAPQ